MSNKFRSKKNTNIVTLDSVGGNSNKVHTLETVSNPNTSSFQFENNFVRTSEVEIIESVFCYIPKKIEDVVKIINKQLPSDEFSIFVKGSFDPNSKVYTIEEDWFYPEQKVSTASIDYKEDNSNFNGVIHKHPSGCKNFSGTDKKYINQNFEFSILWVNGGWGEAIANIRTNFGIVQLPMQVLERMDVTIEEEKEIRELVNRKTSKHVYTANNNYKYSNYKPSNNKSLVKPKSNNSYVESDIIDIWDDYSDFHNMSDF